MEECVILKKDGKDNGWHWPKKHLAVWKDWTEVMEKFILYTKHSESVNDHNPIQNNISRII